MKIKKYSELFESIIEFYNEILKSDYLSLIQDKLIEFSNTLVNTLSDNIKNNNKEKYLIYKCHNNSITLKYPLYKVGEIQQSIELNIVPMDDDYFLIEEKIYTFSKEKMESGYEKGYSIQNGWSIDDPDIKYYKCDQYDGLLKLLSDRNIK